MIRNFQCWEFCLGVEVEKAKCNKETILFNIFAALMYKLLTLPINLYMVFRENWFHWERQEGFLWGKRKEKESKLASL